MGKGAMPDEICGKRKRCPNSAASSVPDAQHRQRFSFASLLSQFILGMK